MGGGSWNTNVYNAATTLRASKGIDDFDYSAKVKSGAAPRAIHASVDPKTVAGPASPFAGFIMRESRDSDEHPNSVPVAFFFDVTGSMLKVPQVMQKKLANLMDVIIAKAGLQHPQVLVGAVGDSTCDEFPLQVGQFESDNRFDEQLRVFILEGGGGGQIMESYGLVYYLIAKHTVTDAWEKRGKKGYLFTTGDEAFWPLITVRELERVFGEKEATSDVDVKAMYEAVCEKWEVFHLHAEEGSYPGNSTIAQRWRDLMGERFIVLKNADLLCEVTAGLIHMLETASDIDKTLDDVGVTGADRDTVRNALVPVAGALVAAGKGTGTLPADLGGASGMTTV